jgi:16S rRNA G966 N2-methylase RsmD
VREALFNILGNTLGSLEGEHVLDLFAGSGGLGIEALSRGAAHATFVDSAKPALASVRQNLRELGLEARATVVSGDAVAQAARLVPALPPANLAPGAVIVIEHDRHNAPPDALGSLLRTDQRRYGDTLISFFEVPV